MGTTPAVAVETATTSPQQEAYFRRIHDDAQRALDVAQRARGKGWDPETAVEIVLAEDLAARVEAQVQVAGVAQLVRKLTKDLNNREVVALEAARRVARGDLGSFADAAAAIDKAVRTGLSILTEGILVAPLEGIAKVQVGQNDDGTQYADVYFAGPIRAAGGTAQAMAVLLADVVRRDLGLDAYQPTSAEVERYKEEVPAYKQAAHLQYAPSGEEIELIVKNCPVCINGEGTEREEITGHRDLLRVETNQLRGGAVLVLAEGLTQKAAKILKHVAKLRLDDWNFLEAFVHKGSSKEEAASADLDDDDVKEIAASNKYIQELIAGRPVFGHPSRPGGFRLRYGRGRTSGIASTAIHPVTMVALDEFIAVGTQLKTERPGKGTIATPCESLEGPMVLLDDGELRQVNDVDDYRRLAGRVKQITDLGDILVPYGEFAENNAVLPHASFTIEWWRELVRENAGDDVAEDLASQQNPDYAAAASWSKTYGVPLHPSHTFLWHDVDVGDVKRLRDRVAAEGRLDGADLAWPRDDLAKQCLIRLAVPHTERDGLIRVRRHAQALLAGLGLEANKGRLGVRNDPEESTFRSHRFPTVAWASANAGIPLKPRAPSRVGARMGRPEKADIRKMDPAVHGLVPVGDAGGLQREVAKAAAKRVVELELARRKCGSCGRTVPTNRCKCGGHAVLVAESRPEARQWALGEAWKDALARLDMRKPPSKVKGVVGLMSRSKTPEPLEKAILRAKHRIYTFKDGTVRYDMTDAPLTHFRPSEVGTSVAVLRDLGYVADIHGEPLSREDQVLELRVQDVIPSRSCLEYFARVARYVDELLVHVYGLEPFYRVERPGDLVGHLVAGLAPHTSGAVLGRIVGSTESRVCWAHPYFHTAKRRNCDGDEDALILLVDAFVNFSLHYVPDRRGGLMDLPLVLTTRLDPREIDKEAHNLDTLWRYPLALYEASERHAPAKDVADAMRLVETLLATPHAYEGLGYTHDTPSIQAGPVESSYKTLGTMFDKMEKQLALAARVRAVDAGDVAGRVLSTHLLPDILGNLKAFSRQKLRCTKCNAKYRRVPLGGVCTKVASDRRVCANPLTLTVPQAGVRKYLALSLDIANRYPIPSYTRERVKLAQRFVDDSFAPERFKKAKLEEFA